MRTISFVVALLVGALGFARVATAQRADDAIVFAGLRPTEDADLKVTAIRRLAEAQVLRQVTENVLAAVSGRKVAGHEQLRQLLGNGYLVDLVDCGGEARCILRLVKPLGPRGYKQVVVGDYYVDAAAKQYRFRITQYPIVGKGAPVTASFALPEASVEDPKAWQIHLDALFSNRGKLELISNVDGYACKVDRKPCEIGPDQLLSLDPGEHVIELSKAGYVTRSRVVTVEAGKSTKVALGLDALPLQAGASPTRLAEGLPTGKGGTSVFGRVQLTAIFDDQNLGDIFDGSAEPDGSSAHEWNLALLPNNSFLGAAVSGAKEPGRFQVNGILLVGIFYGRLLRLPIANINLVREELGLKITIGRMLQPLVNTLAPGTLGEQDSFGSLSYTLTGARLSKTFGPLVFEVGSGRPEGGLAGDIVPASEALSQLPFAEARVAYLDPDHSGTLYRQSTPLMIGVSGAWGLQRLGPNEAGAVRGADPTAVDPLIEDQPAWVASSEVILPFKKFVLAGEVYVARGGNPYGAAMFQPSRVDPMTGEHTQLRSVGSWGQISYIPSPGWEALVVTGFDKVYDGFDGGVAVNGGRALARNHLMAAVVSWAITSQLGVGLQVHRTASRYDDGSKGTLLGGILDTQFNF
jgi:hypothetical protein